MTRIVGSTVVLGVVAVSGCSQREWSPDDIEPGPVSGLIGGARWTMKTAEVETDSTELSITLFADDDVETCTYASSDRPMVMFSVDAAVGEYPLSLPFGGRGRTVTLLEPPAKNNIAAEGLIDVRSLSDDQVAIGLVASMNDENEVNGNFTADRCPDPTF